MSSASVGSWPAMRTNLTSARPLAQPTGRSAGLAKALATQSAGTDTSSQRQLPAEPLRVPSGMVTTLPPFRVMVRVR